MVAGVINGQFNSRGVAGIPQIVARTVHAASAVPAVKLDRQLTGQQRLCIGQLAKAFASPITVTATADVQPWSTPTATPAYKIAWSISLLPAMTAVRIICHPSSLSTVISVAITSSGDRASFSNQSPQLDFCAPGQSIWTTDGRGDHSRPGDYASVNGTSFLHQLQLLWHWFYRINQK